METPSGEIQFATGTRSATGGIADADVTVDNQLTAALVELAVIGAIATEEKVGDCQLGSRPKENGAVGTGRAALSNECTAAGPDV